MDCIFCRIRDGEIPSVAEYRDDKCFVIKDIDPKAPVHLLIIPIEHLDDCASLADRAELAGHIFKVAEAMVQRFELGEGYRLITNKGKDGGQSVKHLHFHLLGGKALTWPEL